jgi:peptidoglycan/LPS O-acetylase OafA/YrhL
MRRPAGFVVLSIVFALAAVEGAWLLVATTPYPESPALLGGRLLAVVFSTLTGAVAVALWRCEPWADRLTVWWAAAVMALLAAGAVSTLGLRSLLSPFLLFFLLLVGGVLLLLVRYVEGRVAAARRPRRGVRIL